MVHQTSVGPEKVVVQSRGIVVCSPTILMLILLAKNAFPNVEELYAQVHRKQAINGWKWSNVEIKTLGNLGNSRQLNRIG